MRDSHMKWRGRKKSSNVEDRRGKSISGKGIAGLGGVGIIIMVAIALITGNPTMILEQLLGIKGNNNLRQLLIQKQKKIRNLQILFRWC